MRHPWSRPSKPGLSPKPWVWPGRPGHGPLPLSPDRPSCSHPLISLWPLEASPFPWCVEEHGGPELGPEFIQGVLEHSQASGNSNEPGKFGEAPVGPSFGSRPLCQVRDQACQSGWDVPNVTRLGFTGLRAAGGGGGGGGVSQLLPPMEEASRRRPMIQVLTS